MGNKNKPKLVSLVKGFTATDDLARFTATDDLAKITSPGDVPGIISAEDQETI